MRNHRGSADKKPNVVGKMCVSEDHPGCCMAGDQEQRLETGRQMQMEASVGARGGRWQPLLGWHLWRWGGCGIRDKRHG